LTGERLRRIIGAAIFSRKNRPAAVTILSAMAREHSTQRRSQSVADRVDWPAVLAEHGRWLRTVVMARLGDLAAADDVLQEVALAAVEKGHQLRDPASAAPWLYRLAVVAALQYRRRQGRRRKLVERFVQRQPPAEFDTREADPLDWLLADELQVLVRQALARLPRRDAEILLLKYTEDWSYRKLAEHLGLSTSAVEARLHRARQKMRRALAKVDPSLVAVSREQ
jgi:RNA polymerase sigma-70 factor (ECF subfamily)